MHLDDRAIYVVDVSDTKSCTNIENAKIGASFDVLVHLESDKTLVVPAKGILSASNIFRISPKTKGRFQSFNWCFAFLKDRIGIARQMQQLSAPAP